MKSTKSNYRECLKGLDLSPLAMEETIAEAEKWAETILTRLIEKARSHAKKSKACKTKKPDHQSGNIYPRLVRKADS